MKHPFQRTSNAQCPSRHHGHYHRPHHHAKLPPPPASSAGHQDCDDTASARKRAQLSRAGDRIKDRAGERGRAGLRASRSLGKAIASDVRTSANIVEAVAIGLLPPRLVSAVDYATQQVADYKDTQNDGHDAVYTFEQAKQDASAFRVSDHEDAVHPHECTSPDA